VIGFEEKDIGVAHLEADRIGQIAKVGGDGDFDALGFERKSNRIDSVVGNGEAGDFEIANGKTGAGLE